MVQIKTTPELHRVLVRKLPLMVHAGWQRLPLGNWVFLKFLVKFSIFGIVILYNFRFLNDVLN